MALSRLFAIAFSFACTVSGSSAGTTDGGGLVGVAPQYNFLQNSTWYVPTETLTAVELNLRTGDVRGVVDQTVWQIQRYAAGYFWGRTIVLLTRPATREPIGDPVCLRLFGSVTPDGRIYITFINEDDTTALGAVTGIGTLFQAGLSSWRFQMQMASGLTSVIAHWSYMDQCRAGQSCQARLPGTNLSLSQFEALCPG